MEKKFKSQKEVYEYVKHVIDVLKVENEVLLSNYDEVVKFTDEERRLVTEFINAHEESIKILTYLIEE